MRTGPAPRPFARDRRPDARAAPVELLADEHAVEAAEAEPAELLGNVEVHQAELVRLRDHVDRMLHLLVVLGLLRPDLLLGELARELAQRLLLVRQRERDAAGAACSIVAMIVLLGSID